MKLFDFYITEEDKDKHFLQRTLMGPEYRNIIMAFKNHPNLGYKSFDQREVHLNQPEAIIHHAGYVRHYGKAISVKDWEAKCAYYMTFEKYREKWARRRGHAIHTTSSFNQQLIRWSQKDTHGIPLTKELQKQDCYR